MVSAKSAERSRCTPGLGEMVGGYWPYRLSEGGAGAGVGSTARGRAPTSSYTLSWASRISRRQSSILWTPPSPRAGGVSTGGGGGSDGGGLNGADYNERPSAVCGTGKFRAVYGATYSLPCSPFCCGILGVVLAYWPSATGS